MTEFMTTVYPAPADVEKMKDNIETLQNLNASQRRLLNEKTGYIESAKAIILEAFDNDNFDKDVVTAIAEALDIELTKEYSVTINVTFSGTITAPLGMDPDDFERQLDFTAEPNGWGDSYEMDVDLFEDGIDLNIND